MAGKPSETRLGEHLRKALESLPAADRPLCVQDLEAKARVEGDLQTLRVIKDYREMSRLPPTSTKPPESA